MQAKNRQLSIKNIIVIVFILAMLISTSVIGHLIITRWLSSAEHNLECIVKNVNERIYNQIYAFVHAPEHINEVNYNFIENGILDLYDKELREKYFVAVLNSQDEAIYGFGYGTANGEYYGAGRNGHGVIEYIQSNASTGNHSWYYSVNEDLTVGDMVADAGPFDPRNQPWYKAAEESGGSTFSPIYKHFAIDDLAISAVWPIYDNDHRLQGVMGTKMLLTNIENFLEDTVQEFNGYAFIIEKDTGYLIANSMEIDNFVTLQDGTIKRYNLGEINNPDIQKAYAYYNSNPVPNFIFTSENGKIFVNMREIQMGSFNWVVISAIPEGYYMANVSKSIYETILLILLAMLFSLIVYDMVTGRLLKPMDNLLQVSSALASGDLSQRVKVVRQDEIGTISESMNQVADKMQFLINDLLCKDNLTGLHNRRCFEENSAQIDHSGNLPLSVIFADVNGLKMTNDIFGHTAGDELIKKTSEILVQSCRKDDLIARVGGDEFIVLLPNTDEKEAKKIRARIAAGFSQARVEAIKCSVSMGIDTKSSAEQRLEEVMSNAENAMYQDKIINRKKINEDIILTLIETLHAKNSREKQHSVVVSDLCVAIGEAMQLPATTISKLKSAGFLHDIGKITLDEKLFLKDAMTMEEYEKMRQHPVTGYRILNLFDNTLDLAEYVYSHHENWDGSGYPRGLKGDEIDLLARIISVSETYERVLNRGNRPIEERQQSAINVIRTGTGKQFDPHIAELFVQMIQEKNSKIV